MLKKAIKRRELEVEWRMFDIVTERGSMSRRELRQLCMEVDSRTFNRLLERWRRAKEIGYDDTMVWDQENAAAAAAAAAAPSYRELAVRVEVWDKTNGQCWYCGKQTNPFRDFQIDHVVPQAHGGTDDRGNLVPACQACNQRKGAQSLDSFRRGYGIGHRFWFEQE